MSGQYIVASAFRAFMGQAGIICGQESPLNRLCRTLDITIPSEYDSACSFAESCIGSLKSKADLLKKSSKSDLKRTAALDIVSRMCFFKDFREFKAYAESFARLPYDQKITSGNTLKLCLSLLRLSKFQSDQFTQSIIAGASTCISVCSGDDITESLRLTNIVFSDDAISDKFGPLLEGEFTSILKELYNYPLQNLLMMALSMPCIKNGSPQAWSDLSGISVGMLLRKQLLYIDKNIMHEVSVNEFLVRKILSSVHDFAENKAYLLDLSLTPAEIQGNKKRIISSLGNVKTKAEASKALAVLIKEFSNATVIDVLCKEHDENGLIKSGVIQNFPADLVRSGESIWKSVPSSIGITFSVFRNKSTNNYLGDDSSTCDVLGLATDKNGRIAGYCQITHANVKSGSLRDLATLMAKAGNSDGLELATSLYLHNSTKPLDSYENTAFVTKWETSRQFQGMGVGKELLSACFDQGLSGLENPSLVSARLDPRNFYAAPPNPKMDDMNPNYHHSKEIIVSAWNKSTSNGTRFGNMYSEFKECYYMPHMHGNPNLKLQSLLVVAD
ncbi:hypothetical protein IFT69_15190 [Pseudomonas putida]|nr:hypothetical protein [Pseudomonas putida]